MILVAWWSILYWAFWAAGWSLWPAGWIWLAGSVVIVVGFCALGARDKHFDSDQVAPDATSADIPGDSPSSSDAGARRTSYQQLGRAAAVLALICAIGVLVATTQWPQHGFRAMWALCILGVIAASAASFTSAFTSAPAASRRTEPSTWLHLGALGLAIGIGVLSLFIHLPDLDDSYYVNRSVWIAEHGTSMVRDTMFGPGTFKSPYNGGIPIASIEGLIGVLSHLTGIQVGTLTWDVSTGVASAMAVWALWALARIWSPRLPLLVTVVAVAFLLMSGESRLGNFWIARMWQGKVMAIAILMPLAWVWATQVVEARSKGSRRPIVMLAIGGVAFAGLTSTAVILAPLMSGAMVMAAIFVRSKRLAIGGLLFLVGPVLSGLAVIAFSDDVGGKDPALLSGSQTFLRVLGPERFFLAAALVALVLGALLVRSKVASAMVLWVSLAALVILAPPLLDAANSATGAGPILWRVLYCIPIALLVGLLAVARIPGSAATVEKLNRLAAFAIPVVLLAAIAGFGAPLWNTVDHNGPVTLSSSPSWKVDEAALDDVRAVMKTDPHGVILLPARQMRILSMYTTKAYAVDPRDWYARTLKEPKGYGKLRLALKNLAQRSGKMPPTAVVKEALTDLKVTQACVSESGAFRTAQVVDRLTYAGYGDPARVGRMTCYTPG